VLTQQVEPVSRNLRLDAAFAQVLEKKKSEIKRVLCSCDAWFGSRVTAVGSPGGGGQNREGGPG
jgi:hypothetical protein